MSIESVQDILFRAVREEDYRELLFSDPNTALDGYELNEQEEQALKGIQREAFDAVSGELEERISKAGMHGIFGRFGDRDLVIERLFGGYDLPLKTVISG